MIFKKIAMEIDQFSEESFSELKLILEDVVCIDEEYKGKEKPEFELPPKGKKIFNLRVIGDNSTFDFEIIN